VGLALGKGSRKSLKGMGDQPIRQPLGVQDIRKGPYCKRASKRPVRGQKDRAWRISRMVACERKKPGPTKVTGGVQLDLQHERKGPETSYIEILFSAGEKGMGHGETWREKKTAQGNEKDQKFARREGISNKGAKQRGFMIEKKRRGRGSGKDQPAGSGGTTEGQLP